MPPSTNASGRSATGSERPPTTDHRPQTTDHRPPTTDHRPQTTDHRPQTTDHRPLVMPSRRIERINHLLRQEIADLLTREVNDEALSLPMISIIDVETSADLRVAK